MKKIIVIAVILAVGWYGNYRYRQNYGQRSTEDRSYTDIPKPEVSSKNSQFKCDGRTRCSQMTSCEEAMFFLKNCPDVKMDGNNDGIPCESQWCK